MTSVLNNAPRANGGQNPHRKIRFRGQRTLNGEWVEGDLIYWHGDPDHPCIQTDYKFDFGQVTVNAYEVIPETIEQILSKLPSQSTPDPDY